MVHPLELSMRSEFLFSDICTRSRASESAKKFSEQSVIVLLSNASAQSVMREKIFGAVKYFARKRAALSRRVNID